MLLKLAMLVDVHDTWSNVIRVPMDTVWQC